MATDPKELERPASAPTVAEKPAREIPSFTKVAEERRDARTAELTELAGVTPGSKTDNKPADKPADFDFDGEWNKLPENFRTGIVNRFNDTYNQRLGEQYGDVLPLVVEANKNPNLRATLAAAAQDPELLTLLGDEKARGMLKDLSKKELREFLFGEAKTTYEKYATQKPAGAPEVDPRDARLAQLETTIADDRSTRETQGYIGERQREVAALTSAFPDLAKPESRKQLEHVINYAEERFETAAMRAGIKTRDANGNARMQWPAEALRAGIKAPSYRETHEMYAEILGRTAPPAAPATSRASIPAPAQAPRDASEGKQRALSLLKNSGGLKGLATASTRRR